MSLVVDVVLDPDTPGFGQIKAVCSGCAQRVFIAGTPATVADLSLPDGHSTRSILARKLFDAVLDHGVCR